MILVIGFVLTEVLQCKNTKIKTIHKSFYLPFKLSVAKVRVLVETTKFIMDFYPELAYSMYDMLPIAFIFIECHILIAMW